MTSATPTKTILYYTSNREAEDFERKIRNNILRQNPGLPIVSVSQRPVKLGRNICVGERGHSYLNAFRQMLVGARECDTDYLVFCESDFLYPQEYFLFEPMGGNLYRYDNVWIIFHSNINRKACRKHYSNGAQVARRQWVVEQLEKYLEGQPEWSVTNYRIRKPDWNGATWEWFSGPPAVTFKTGRGVTARASIIKDPAIKTYDLPYWGSLSELRATYDVR